MEKNELPRQTSSRGPWPTRSWIRRRGAFGLDPELPLTRGAFHAARPLFHAFTDPAPDRWGQTLLRRYERLRARKEGRPPRTLSAVDFLVLVDDETRLGALRFQEGRGRFLPHLDRPRSACVKQLDALAAQLLVLGCPS
jgi:serine/threonine-protein kinase HipA